MALSSATLLSTFGGRSTTIRRDDSYGDRRYGRSPERYGRSPDRGGRSPPRRYVWQTRMSIHCVPGR